MSSSCQTESTPPIDRTAGQGDGVARRDGSDRPARARRDVWATAGVGAVVVPGASLPAIGTADTASASLPASPVLATGAPATAAPAPNLAIAAVADSAATGPAAPAIVSAPDGSPAGTAVAAALPEAAAGTPAGATYVAAASAPSAGGSAAPAAAVAAASASATAPARDPGGEDRAAPPDTAALLPAASTGSGSGARALVIDVASLAGAVTVAADTSAGSSAVALDVAGADAAYLAATGNALTGAGLTIGIMSDSFDLTGGEASDIADGLLPAASQINILKEGSDGEDEGRAMAQLVHQIAPGATIDFYTATASESDFAAGITALVNAGCNVIVDDVLWTDEPFFQDTGVITQAAEAAVAAGVDYFTSAGNQANNFYEAVFNPETIAMPGFAGNMIVSDVSAGSPYIPVYLSLQDPTLDFTLEWTEPFGASRYDIGVALYSYSGTTGDYTLVTSFSTADLGGDPVLSVDTVLTVPAGIYYLAFYENASEQTGGVPVTPGTFKLIFFQGSNAHLNASGEGVGSGTSIGHELAPGVNTVAAVAVGNTPSQGVATPVVEGFSGYGPGETYFDAAGTALATPIDDGKPDFAATDDTETSVFKPFQGTSAAAPNAAAVSLLMLQADSRLAPAQITYLLERSAIPTGNTTTGGAGLIQANTAVAGALTAATTPIWTAQDGSSNWSDKLNWSDSAVPGTLDTVEITDGLGLFTAAYSVDFDVSSDAVAALLLDGGSITGALPDLLVPATHVLSAGSLTLGSGTLDLTGTLADAGALLAGSAAGAITVESTGRLSVAAAATGAEIEYHGVGGQVVFGAASAATLLTGLTASIGNFAEGDVLDLSGLPADTVAGVEVNGDVVTVVNAAGAALATLEVSGAFTQLGFGADHGGGTEILACFCTGTRIATEFGDVPVEQLRPGQRVRSLDGGLMPVRWLGRSRKACVGASAPHAEPVRIRADAFGPALPARDLLVSPCHALYLDGLLIQAGALVDGVGIVRETAVPPVLTYWHVELETHALLLAEGMPAESYLEGIEPLGFDNWHERIAPPDVRELPYPRCKSARQVPPALRRRMAPDRLRRAA